MEKVSGLMGQTDTGKEGIPGRDGQIRFKLRYPRSQLLTHWAHQFGYLLFL